MRVLSKNFPNRALSIEYRPADGAFITFNNIKEASEANIMIDNDTCLDVAMELIAFVNKNKATNYTLIETSALEPPKYDWYILVKAVSIDALINETVENAQEWFRNKSINHEEASLVQLRAHSIVLRDQRLSKY